MKKFIAFACFFTLLIVIACSSEKQDSSSNKTAEAKPAAKKIDGEKIYKTYCITCHGINGDMVGSGTFDLTVTELNLEERIEVITKGRNLMTPFEGLFK